METIYLTGGVPLEGSVRIQGSKNAALPMMAAALLHRGTTTLENCPRIRDVFCMIDILHTLGAKTAWEDHVLHIDCTDLCPEGIVHRQHAVRMRSSVTCMGSLLGRLGTCQIPYPGGCMIGRRPVDIHLELFRRMGAEITEKDGMIYGTCEDRCGFSYHFPKRSVGATENGILAAILLSGKTVLENCATEPEIVWLCHLLVQMGSRIKGIGTECLHIMGVPALKNVRFRVPPDRIVAGTYLCAGAITRGNIVLEEAPVREMQAILSIYEKMGGQYKEKGGKLFTNSIGVAHAVPLVETAVYPGLPTDLQSQLLTVLVVAEGKSLVRETVFENRFLVADQLAKLGADITVCGNEAVVKGKKHLQGNAVEAQELRGGAALVLAGLAASGVTSVSGAQYIERGYEDICGDLKSLGAEIHKGIG